MVEPVAVTYHNKNRGLVVAAPDVTLGPVGTVRLSPAREDELVRSYLTGATAAALASRYGMSKTPVQGFLIGAALGSIGVDVIGSTSHAIGAGDATRHSWGRAEASGASGVRAYT